jgi:hypothetical protein
MQLWEFAEGTMEQLRRKNQLDMMSIEAARKRFLDSYALMKPGLLGGLLETVMPPYVDKTALTKLAEVETIRELEFIEKATGRKIVKGLGSAAAAQLTPEQVKESRKREKAEGDRFAELMGITGKQGRRIMREGRGAFDPNYVQNNEPPDSNLWGVISYTDPTLTDALSNWAGKFLLTFEGKPAGWAMDTALETLRAWRGSFHYPLVCLKWHHTIQMHETFPSGNPEFSSALTGESEAEEVAKVFSIRIEIPRWDRANGEEEQEFRSRFDAACANVREDHIRESREWTERRAIEEAHYCEGLAMWQAGWDLSKIHHALIDRGLHVGGQDPKDSNYNSAISKGLSRIAKSIELDRRPRR